YHPSHRDGHGVIDGTAGSRGERMRRNTHKTGFPCCLVCITGFVPSHRRVRGARSEAAGMLPSGYRQPDA
ncbi:MAG: hypothetical protein ACREVJ_07165, partial [Gammaproteobacteria bacterium]